MNNQDRKLFVSKLKTLESKLRGTYNGNLELEVRFYKLSQHKTKLDKMDYGTFQRVLNHYKKIVPYTEKQFTDTIYDNFRLTTYNGKQKWSEKTRLDDVVDERFSIKYSLSEEKDNVKPPKNIKNKTPFERQKQRTSFDFGVGVLDMTIVRSSNDIAYEIEFEMNEKKPERVLNQLEAFSIAAQNVWKVIHDTDILYTIEERSKFISYINRCISGKENKYGTINRIQPQARNLKRRDMVEGGLCLGEINYSVTDKADGERCFLVLSPWGVIIAKSHSLNLIYTYNLNLNPANFDWIGYIFDAELTYTLSQTEPATNGSKRLILAFDTVSTPKPNASYGTLEIQNRAHDFRLDSLKIFYNTVWKDIFWDAAKKYNFHLTVKDFFAFQTPEEFYPAMKQILVLSQQRNYKTDGFIFTPVQSPYILLTDSGKPIDKLPLEERVLTQYPDICKLKPVEELTIDFTYDPSTPNTLYSFDPETKELTQFNGTEKYPLNDVTVDTDNKLLSINEPMIIEFMFDKAKRMFVPTRYRPDKPVPNLIAIAQDVWEDIFEPIAMSTYVGHDTVLMTEYHKREIEKYLNGAYRKGGKLLDYGISSLVSIQNEDVDVFTANDKVVQADFAFIYTYDFRKKSQDRMFEHLFKSLSSNGFIFYIGVNPNVVQTLMKMMQTDSLTLYDYGSLQTIREKGVNKVIFHYNPAKGVGNNSNEKEYNIRGDGYSVDEIVEIFNNKGFSLVVGEQMRTEKFMNPLEFVLSASFSLLVFKKTNKPKAYRPLSPTVERMSKIALKTMKLSIDVKPEPPSKSSRSSPNVHSESRHNSPNINENKRKSETESPQENELQHEEISYRTMLTRDDKIEDLEAPWFTDNHLVRIGTIADGTCLIHSILKALVPAYNDPQLPPAPNMISVGHLADESLSAYRIDMANRFRFGLADNLMQMWSAEGRKEFDRLDRMTKKEMIKLVKETHPKITPSSLMAMNKEKIIVHYLLLKETIFYHYFGSIYEEYKIMDDDVKNEFTYVPTLSGLETLFKSAGYLGDESYGMLSDVLQTDFVVLRATADDLLFHDTTIQAGSKNKVVLINGTGVHYELIGMVTEDLQIQTTFAYNDPLITAIQSLKTRTMNA